MIRDASTSPARGGLLIATLVIADAAWLYAACGIVGFFAGQEGSPLPWAAVPALVGLGVLAARRIGRQPLSRRHSSALRVALGAAAAYAAAAVSRPAGGAIFGPGWAPALIGGELAAGAVASLLVALLMSAALWRHGLALAATRSPYRRLLASFRIGLVAFTLALLVEQASDRDLHAGAMLVPFFAASLAGLAASRVPEGSRVRAAWVRTVSACIVAVVGLGLALGATASVFGRTGVDVVRAAWVHLGGALARLVRALLGAIADGLMGLVGWLEAIGVVAGPDGAAEPAAGGESALRALEPPGALGDALGELAQVVLLCLMVYAFVRLLAYAFRELPHRGEAPLAEEHEFIGQKADPLSDLATLLRRLWPGLAASDAPIPRPDARGIAPGIREVLELYFELVSEALLRGHVFVAARTPSERAAALAAAIPGAPVADITARFNAACYGNEPTDAETLAALRRALEIAVRRRAEEPRE